MYLSYLTHSRDVVVPRADPLLTEGMNTSKVARIVANLQTPDFWTAVPGERFF